MEYQSSFSEGVSVKYDGIEGKIKYVGPYYLTISITNTSSILVYKKNWAEIKLLKESET